MFTHLTSTALRKTFLISILSAGILAVGWSSHDLFAATGPCTAPSTNYGTATATVAVPSTGTYRVWTRMSAANTTANTYMLEIDGSSCYTIGGSTVPTYASGATTFFGSTSTNWISKTSAGTQMDISLASGNHTFKLIGNADGVIVDRLVLTQDTTCVPTGTGNNCAIPPDTTPPVVSITSPATGASLTAATTVTANATDDVAVSKVEFYVDGVLKNTDTTAPYSYSLDPSTLSIGTHTLTAKAYDTNGNTATSASVSVTIPDTTPPTITLTTPANNATISGTITVTGTANDAVAFDSANLHIDGNYITNTTTPGPYSFSIDTTKYTNGAHTLYVRAYDAAGNKTDTPTITLNVSNQTTPPPDTTPPTVSLTAPIAGATISGTYALTANASDASGIKQVQFYVDGSLKNTDTTAPYSYSLDTTSLSNGSHSFKVVATDNSTNQNAATSTTVSATVNNVTYIPADINQDGHVNYLDLSILSSQYGKSGSAITVPRADVNGDGTVNYLDLSAVAAKYGT